MRGDRLMHSMLQVPDLNHGCLPLASMVRANESALVCLDHKTKSIPNKWDLMRLVFGRAEKLSKSLFHIVDWAAINEFKFKNDQPKAQIDENLDIYPRPLLNFKIYL